jgi:tRNA-binding protein
MHLEHDPNASAAPAISFDEFLRVDIRVGTIVKVDQFPEAKKPALKLTIDFGSVIGLKRSSAQIVANYRSEELIGKQIAAVVNFPSRQIGPFRSEVLTLGFPDDAGKVVLFSPDRRVPNGGRLF